MLWDKKEEFVSIEKAQLLLNNILNYKNHRYLLKNITLNTLPVN